MISKSIDSGYLVGATPGIIKVILLTQFLANVIHFYSFPNELKAKISKTSILQTSENNKYYSFTLTVKI